MATSFFKMFNVEDKIEELKASLSEGTFSDLTNKNVAVAVPVYDESMRNIKLFDSELYITQKNDSEQLQNFLLTHAKASTVSIVAWRYNVPETSNFDYLILLHEFTESEESSLVEELKSSGSKDLKICTLY